jgi:hypothetical protein
VLANMVVFIFFVPYKISAQIQLWHLLRSFLSNIRGNIKILIFCQIKVVQMCSRLITNEIFVRLQNLFVMEICGDSSHHLSFKNTG